MKFIRWRHFLFTHDGILTFKVWGFFFILWEIFHSHPFITPHWYIFCPHSKNLIFVYWENAGIFISFEEFLKKKIWEKYIYISLHVCEKIIMFYYDFILLFNTVTLQVGREFKSLKRNYSGKIGVCVCLCVWSIKIEERAIFQFFFLSFIEKRENN